LCVGKDEVYIVQGRGSEVEGNFRVVIRSREMLASGAERVDR